VSNRPVITAARLFPAECSCKHVGWVRIPCHIQRRHKWQPFRREADIEFWEVALSGDLDR